MSFPAFRSPTMIRGVENPEAKETISFASVSRLLEAASSRCVEKKLTFLPPTLMVTCATERLALRKRELTDAKLYAEIIKFPSCPSGNFGTKCVNHVRPVLCVKELTRGEIPSGGISQTAMMSGFIRASQLAWRS